MNKKGKRGNTRRAPLDETDVELRSLRKGAGISRSRLRRSRRLLQLCHVADDDAESAFERIEAEVRKLREDDVGTALRNALNLGSPWPTEKLEERRRRLASAVGVNPDTIEARENEGFDELRSALDSSDYFESTIILAEERVLVRDRHVVHRWNSRTVKALDDGVHAYAYGVVTDMRLEPLTGGQWTFETHDAAYDIYGIEFGTVLRRGETHNFTYLMTADPADERPDHDLVGETFYSLTPEFRLAVQFVGERPPQVWRYADTPEALVTQPFQESDLLTLDWEGQASIKFFNRRNGMSAGIAWRW